MNNWDLMFRALPGIPLIKPGDDLASIIVTAAQKDGFTFREHDLIVVASKIVSKAENRLVKLADVIPCERAKRLSERTGRDARLCQLYLDESKARLDVKGRHVVTVDRRGFQGTGAGVDMSNVAPRSDGIAILLPEVPDASARRIRQGIRAQTNTTVAVIVSDSFGSGLREGAYGAAIGIAGIRYFEEPEGGEDLFGNASRPLINRVDELASAASILMGQTDAAVPVIIGRGATYTVDENACLASLLIGPPLPDSDYDLRPEF